MFTAGCHENPETRNCVDANGRVVSDTRCEDAGLYSSYHYVYGGSSGGNWGDSVVGGSTTPSSGSGASFGGFGHASGGEGGGE